jgi:hypothetical protein
MFKKIAMYADMRTPTSPPLAGRQAGSLPVPAVSAVPVEATPGKPKRATLLHRSKPPACLPTRRPTIHPYTPVSATPTYNCSPPRPSQAAAAIDSPSGRSRAGERRDVGMSVLLALPSDRTLANPTQGQLTTQLTSPTTPLSQASGRGGERPCVEEQGNEPGKPGQAEAGWSVARAAVRGLVEMTGARGGDS